MQATIHSAPLHLLRKLPRSQSATLPTDVQNSRYWTICILPVSLKVDIVGREDSERAVLNEYQNRDTRAEEPGLDGAQEARGVAGLGECYTHLRQGGSWHAHYGCGRQHFH